MDLNWEVVLYMLAFAMASEHKMGGVAICDGLVDWNAKQNILWSMAGNLASSCTLSGR